MKTTREKTKDAAASSAPAETQPAPEVSEPVPVPVVVEEITVEKFARSIANKDLAGAYLSVERMKRPVRKMTREGWQKDFDEWCAAPRR